MSEIRRDRWGRALLNPSDGGKPVAHTRATKMAETLDDRYHLEKWLQRMTALGVASRPDLLALAQAATPADKAKLNEVCEKAVEAAGGGERANKGTALHQFTERLDRGEQLEVPPPWDRDVSAYYACLTDCGIEVLPNYVEVLVVNTQLPEPVAGSADRIVKWQGDLCVFDLKTGANLSYSWKSIAQQLAIYANASTIYDPADNEHTNMPEVRRDRAIVFHLPAGEAQCTPYLVDIEAGWEAVQHAGWTRQWRKRKDLAQVLKPTATILNEDRQERLEAA